MKKITFLLTLFATSMGFAQVPVAKIQQYLNENRAKYELSTQDIQEWFVESEASSTSTGIHNYYIKQKYQGTELYNSLSNIWIKNDAVINGGQGLISNVSAKVNSTTPLLSALDALNSAITLLEITNSGSHQIIETINDKTFKISNGTLEDPITAKLVYQLTSDNNLRLAWDFTIDIVGHKHLWSVRIDALNGKILEKNDMVISCNFDSKKPTAGSFKGNAFSRNFFKNNTASLLDVQAGNYNVIPYNYESPNHSPRQIISSPSNATASPYGWHDTNGATGNEYTTTRGNNVFAQDDTDGNDGTGTTANGGTTLNFDFPYGGVSAQPSTYLNAALTNLFYMNNIMHDVWYQYGFNEVNGNFQQNNYGKGGTTSVFGDAVFADAQDGSGTNNANFSTPVDATRPRMQMYLWNYGPKFFFVTSPTAVEGSYDAVQNGFSPGHVDVPAAPSSIQTDLALYLDGSGTTSIACDAASNPAQLNGKIVILRRGTCTFAEKVKFAQNAGAVAVVVVDNLPNELVTMSGADATITIPAVFITQELGEALITQMQSGPVNVKLQSAGAAFVNTDGDFDNLVISHEYGHGISTRLTGGPANSSCLNNAEQMGEGWSDWFGLMMQLKSGDVGETPRPVATFVVSEDPNGAGIRSHPYSTDMSVNPLTFNDSNDTESHNRGEFMAAVLWDLTWAYINKYGYDSNIYTGTGGNNKVMRLVIDALKLQPCSPTVVEFRTALIAADQATTGGHDYCLITEVFRRRGVGLNASSGSRTVATDQVEDFTAFPPGPNCTLSANYFENEELFRVYPNPTNGYMNVRINNFVGKVNIQVIDINGRIVSEYKNEEFNIEKTLNLNNLQSGAYVLKVSGDTLNFTKKIIKN